ncbi:hypothetical protein BDP81DRAFT_332223 [Colletotrichum phormii]|uniref:Uncharacterized protein n=1 Tax=Colletotrichum phormii TaxID=359342 RepID=A0AAI9ZF08_9PEZI|nr:uncharacterized protein BDP81DRAFT_332223 [Colletotrichum phormii]KAK1623330.1 hypothetical protein BDP81DRAFT_332223 [Colletotrichum phormii]
MPSDHFIHSGFTLVGRNNLVRASSAKDSYSDSAYQRLARELALYVMKTTSPNNPQRHVPTDDDLRYQGRWILFDDDDPLNETPADNALWLEEFKRDVGLSFAPTQAGDVI